MLALALPLTLAVQTVGSALVSGALLSQPLAFGAQLGEKGLQFGLATRFSLTFGLIFCDRLRQRLTRGLNRSGFPFQSHALVFPFQSHTLGFEQSALSFSALLRDLGCVFARFLRIPVALYPERGFGCTSQFFFVTATALFLAALSALAFELILQLLWSERRLTRFRSFATFAFGALTFFAFCLLLFALLVLARFLFVFQALALKFLLFALLTGLFFELLGLDSARFALAFLPFAFCPLLFLDLLFLELTFLARLGFKLAFSSLRASRARSSCSRSSRLRSRSSRFWALSISCAWAGKQDKAKNKRQVENRFIAARKKGA
jgi:hypothetical protein